MADHILASAEVDKKGERGIYAVIIRERDSEVIGEDEKKMQLLFAAHQAKLKVVGPIFFQYLTDEEHANWRDRFIELHMAAEAKAACGVRVLHDDQRKEARDGQGN
jgi:hypothetical protein